MGEIAEYYGKGQSDHDRTENMPEFLFAVTIDQETKHRRCNRIDDLSLNKNRFDINQLLTKITSSTRIIELHAYLGAKAHRRQRVLIMSLVEDKLKCRRTTWRLLDRWKHVQERRRVSWTSLSFRCPRDAFARWHYPFSFLRLNIFQDEEKKTFKIPVNPSWYYSGLLHFRKVISARK